MAEPTDRILIVAGEASGDLHGSNLVKVLSRILPDCEFTGMGGKKMRAAGVRTLFGIDRMGTVGAVEILADFAHYWKVYRTLVSEIREKKFDAAILIDYPTLNLRLAKHCRRAGCPVFFFISPQIWAWRRGRIKNIRRTVDQMFVVLPFEESLYTVAGVKAEFLGHPFVDLVRPSKPREETIRELGLNPEWKTVGLLPGSRKNEIESLLDIMLESAGRIKQEVDGCQFVLPVADTIDSQQIRDRLGSNPLNIQLVSGKTYDVMNCCDFLIVASGSATLEAGILGCPMVIIYKLQPLTYLLARWMIKTSHVGLVNIVAGERVVPELIQHEVTPENIVSAALAILKNPEADQEVRDRLSRIGESLGPPGVMQRVGERIAGQLRRRLTDEKVSA